MKKKNLIKAKQIGLSNADIFKIQQTAKKAADKTKEESIEKAFLYMLAIPLNVLVTDEYWGDEAKEKAPAFIEEVMGLYEAVQDGYVSDDQLSDLLMEMAGVEINADWLNKESKKEGFKGNYI